MVSSDLVSVDQSYTPDAGELRDESHCSDLQKFLFLVSLQWVNASCVSAILKYLFIMAKF